MCPTDWGVGDFQHLFNLSELREHGTLDADQVVDTPWLRLVEQQKNQFAQVWIFPFGALIQNPYVIVNLTKSMLTLQLQTKICITSVGSYWIIDFNIVETFHVQNDLQLLVLNIMVIQKCNLMCVYASTSFYFFTEFFPSYGDWALCDWALILGNSWKFHLSISHVGITFLCGSVSKGMFFLSNICPILFTV